MILAVLSVLVVAWLVQAGVTWHLRPRAVDRLLREHLRDRYLVTIATGETFTGLLSGVDDRTVVLLDVQVLVKDAAPSAVDGEVILRRDTIAYMQRP